MSNIRADTLSTLDGTKSITTDRITQGVARAWVNFNGTGTVAIRASFNVSSITDNGVGDYTANFTTAMPDANYAASGNAGFAAGFFGAFIAVGVTGSLESAPTASSVRFTVFSDFGAVIDPKYVNIAIFR